MDSKFGHHPHPLGYICAKLPFFLASIAELAPGEKLHTQSLDAQATKVLALPNV